MQKVHSGSHWTIVIAPDYRIAASVMRYYALHEMRADNPTRDALLASQDRNYKFQDYDFTSFSEAYRVLEGARPTRIIIVDYLRWQGRPGQVAEVWQMILNTQARQPVGRCQLVWQ